MTRIEIDTWWDRVQLEPDPKLVPPLQKTSSQRVKENGLISKAWQENTGGSCQGFISTARGPGPRPRPQPSSLNSQTPPELARRERKAQVIQDRTVLESDNLSTNSIYGLIV